MIDIGKGNLVGVRGETVSDVFTGIAEGLNFHGLSDGRWSLIDAIFAILREVGPVNLLTISTWTAARKSIEDADRLLKSEKIKDIRFLVDRSFLSRQPKYCNKLISTFGEESIRAWNNHAKFVIFEGGLFDVLYLTSANLNKNSRIENYSLFCGGDLIPAYGKLVDEIFALQGAGEFFGSPKAGRRDTKKLIENNETARKRKTSPVDLSDLTGMKITI